MKFKRAAATSLLLFTGIILLVHSAIPHHHHQLVTFSFETDFMKRGCSAAGDEGHKAGDHKNHHKDHKDHNEGEAATNGCNENQEQCILTKIILPDSQELKRELLSAAKNCLQAMIQLYVNETIDHQFSLGQFFLKPPIFNLSYHTEHISDSQGLRAPPIC